MEYAKTKKKYYIKYNELNTNYALKESMLMLFLQDIATENAETNGFGYSWCNANNYGWFLLKYHIELNEYPKNLEYIEIETESRGASKLFAFRDFSIYTPNNNLIGRVASCWALVDMNNKSMIPPQKANPDFDNFIKREDDLSYSKIILPEEFEYKKNFEIRFDDLDVNHHANNTNYIAWALEALPYEYRMKYTVKNVDIQIKKDASMGDTIISKAFTNLELKQTIHLIINKNTNEDLALMNIYWT